MALAGRLGFNLNLPQMFSNTTRAKLGSLFLASTLIFAFWPTIQIWYQSYSTSGFNYQGFLVLPLISILILKKNSALKRAAVNNNPLGLLLLIFSSMLWIIAIITQMHLVADIALVSMLLSIIFTMYGKKVTRHLLLPLLCLYLLMPAGQNVFFLIQKAIARVLVNSLLLVDNAVYWQDSNIIFANHIYSLNNLLSSLHYLLIFTLIGLGVASLCSKKLLRQLFIISIFVAIPVIFLSLGLFILITLSKWTTVTKISLIQQSTFSWLITAFSICVALFASIKMRTRITTDDIDWHNSLRPNSSWFLTTILSACVIILTPIVGNSIKHNSHFSTNSTIRTPDIVRNWSGPVPISAEQPNTIKVNYTRNEHSVEFSQTKILQQQPWLVNFDSSSNQVKQHVMQIQLSNRTVPVIETILQKNKQPIIVWSVFQINHHLLVNPILIQILVSMYSLSPDGSEVNLITLSSNASNDINAGRMRLRQFMQDMVDSHNAAWLED